MTEFFGIIASFLTLGHFFIGQLLFPESRIPSDNRGTLILIIFTASSLFWTMFGLFAGIAPLALAFSIILIYNCVMLFIKLKIKPELDKRDAPQSAPQVVPFQTPDTPPPPIQ